MRTEEGTTRLPAKAAALLEALVERRGEVLTRVEIRDLLWPGGVVEFDQGINFLIRTIRRALDETARSPRFIETLPKRGYRFIARVSTSEAGATPPPESPAVIASTGVRPDDGNRSKTRRPQAPRAALWLGVATVLAILAFTLREGRSTETLAEAPADGRPDVAQSRLPLLAIIPLADRDAGPRSQAQARAVAEALTADLTTGLDSQWRVLGPAATGEIVADGAESLAARTSLGACLVLSGSVRDLDAATTILFLQVIRTSDQAHLWARLDTAVTNDMVATALASARLARLRLTNEIEPAATGCPR